MTLRSATKWLVVLALALPVIQAVLLWVGALLRGMDDAQGAAIIATVSMVCQVVWSVSLVGLLMLVAIVVLNEPPRENE